MGFQRIVVQRLQLSGSVEVSVVLVEEGTAMTVVVLV